VVVATLNTLADQGMVKPALVAEAIKKYNINSDAIIPTKA
jgi:pyruvate dehydrogenase E1 component